MMTDNLVCLYRFAGGGQFLIRYIFDHEGLVDGAVLEKTFKEIIGGEPDVVEEGQIGPFRGTEDLQKFSFQVCQELNRSQVNIFSPDEYLAILDQSHELPEFKKLLSEGGNIIQNPDKGSNGLLGKIFN